MHCVRSACIVMNYLQNKKNTDRKSGKLRRNVNTPFARTAIG